MQCNVLKQIRKYSKLQHSGVSKRPIFFLKVNKRGRGLEKECPGWDNFEKLTIGAGDKSGLEST